MSAEVGFAVGDRVAGTVRSGEGFAKRDFDGVVCGLEESFDVAVLAWVTKVYVWSPRGAVRFDVGDAEGLRIIDRAAVRSYDGTEAVVLAEGFGSDGWYRTTTGRYAQLARDWSADGHPRVLAVADAPPAVRSGR